MALSNPKRSVIEAVLESGVTGYYGFLYQLRMDEDGTLMARPWATSSDADAVPLVGVIDMPGGKEPNPGGPQVAGAAGDLLNFVVEGVARAFVHVKTRDLATGQELYIGTSGGDSNMKLVNDAAVSPASANSGDVDTAAKISDFVKFVRGQYIESASHPHGGGSYQSVYIRVVNNPRVPA